MDQRAGEGQPGPLAPLREERNYRWFFFGNLASNLGTFCQSIAQSLLVFRLTGSTFLVGVVNFAQYAAVPILAPVAGSVADRYDRRKVLIIAQASAGVAATVLTLLTAFGAINAGVVIVLAAAIGITGAFAFPVGRAFAPLLVSERNLGRAINLDSVSVNIARAIGPVIGALIVSGLGETWAFGVNAVSFFLLAAALLTVRPRAQQVAPARRTRFIDGFGLVRRNPLVGALLFIIAACAIAADPPVTLGPEIAERLGGGDLMAGAILGAFGAGGVVGAFVAGAESHRHHRKVARLLGVLVGGIVIFAVATTLPFTLVGSFLAGFGYLTSQTRSSTLLLRSIEDHERGRVMALWSVAFIGTRPLASLLDGWVGEHVNVRAAALVMAVPAAAALLLSARLDRRRNRSGPPAAPQVATAG